MQKFLKEKNKLSGGFTLIESLVAISIFTFALVGMMAVLGQGISDTGYAQQKIAAEYLAQEGIEYVRNLRDTHMLYATNIDTAWNNFNNQLYAADCHQAWGCYFDDSDLNYTASSQPMLGLDFTACVINNGDKCSDHPLLYDSATGKYGYTTGVNSGFSRKIQFGQINAANETEISSTVFWTQKSGSYSIRFHEKLYKWTE